MNELEIKGKKYISSKRAAELTGYAKDYVGQLARAGKIPGTRVGRAWYVEEAALLSHEGGGLAVIREASAAPKGLTLSPIQRRAAISPATLKAIGYGAQALPETWSPALYFSDGSDFLPKIDKNGQDKAFSELLSGTPIKIRVVSRQELQLPRGHAVHTLSEKARQIRNKRGVTYSALSLGAVTAALGVLLFFSSGFLLSSHLQVSETGAYTANLQIGFEYVRDTLMKFPPFAMGVDSLRSFFTTIGNSFADFLSKGISFIFWLLHWIASLV